MAEQSGSYFAATRHPWASLWFVVPLLAAYEFGVLWLGGENPNQYRNGADFWIRWALQQYGFGQKWAAPVVILVVFGLRTVWEWKDRPKNLFGSLFGMVIESAGFAVLLWAFSRNFHAILQASGISLNELAFNTPAAGNLIRFIGAGIYEELVFRLGLFSLTVVMLRLVLFPGVIAVPVAAVASALAFAAAHHLGSNGEPVESAKFVFRTICGLVFTFIFVTRGFGVAVGAHAGYNILAGIAVQPA